MMKICLDTCAYSKLALQPPDLVLCLDIAERIFLPSIVLGELYAGFIMGKRDRENRESLERFISLPDVEIVKIDENIADRYGSLVKALRQQGKPIPTNDIWIAAVALETGSRLVTYDSHFDCIPGVMIVSP